MAKLGIPGQGRDPLAYVDNRLSTVPAVQSPRRPTVNDTNYPLWTEWRTTKDAVSPVIEGEFWKLIRFESNGDATWVMISSGSSGPMINIETDDGSPNVVPDGTGEIQILGGAGISVTGQGPGKTITVSLTGGGAAIDQIDVDFSTAPGTDPVLPDGTGEITISGSTVANATNANAPVATHSRAANAFNVEVQLSTARTGAPANAFDAGLCSFDDTMFTVDANGFVQLAGGGMGVDQIDVDFSTAPGTDPVVPDGTGQITVQGSTVANATNANAPVATHSRAANTYNIEVQLATARTGAPADAFDAGLCSFDDTMFTVDANGFVQLAGGGLAIDQIDVQFNTVPGTDPVLPDGTGQITVQGAVVANGTNTNAPVATHSRAANTYNVEVQVSTAVTGAPADSFDAGLCSFDDRFFTVTSNGYTSLVGSIGFVWVEETNATRNLLVNQGVVGNRGTSQTFTLPASSAFGDEIRIVNKGVGLISIAQNAGQTIHFGALDTTTGATGSLDATGQWDSIHLVCTTATTDWTVLNSVGAWNVL